jgi:hypothetical protein
MTLRAVRLLDVMLGGEEFAVAGETFSAVESYLFRRRGREMRVVATGASQGVAGGALTLALRQGLELADGARAILSIASQNKIANKIGKVIARLELI